jgi:hypothetical protein
MFLVNSDRTCAGFDSPVRNIVLLLFAVFAQTVFTSCADRSFFCASVSLARSVVDASVIRSPSHHSIRT